MSARNGAGKTGTGRGRGHEPSSRERGRVGDLGSSSPHPSMRSRCGTVRAKTEDLAVQALRNASFDVERLRVCCLRTQQCADFKPVELKYMKPLVGVSFEMD